VYKSIQAGLAYDISGIGLARIQWFGDTMDITPASAAGFTFDADTFDGTVLVPTGTADLPGWKYNKAAGRTVNAARIEAAFKVTAVDNLNLDIGLKLPIPVKDELLGVDVIGQNNFQIGVAGDFTAGDFGVTYGLYTGFGGYYAEDITGVERSKVAATIDIIVVPSFYVAAIDATVGADLGFKVSGESTTRGAGNDDGKTTFGLGAWISRDLGKGLIKTGLAFQLPTYAANGIKGQTSYLTWPIILEVSF
jgi:hypothetical protein